MNENKTIFKEYLDEEKGISQFFKQSKSWLILITALAGIILVWIFIKYVILGSMSIEEVQNSIEIVWHDTKWVKKKSTPYDITIVPTITFRIKNTGERPLHYVNFEGVFEFVESGKVHSDGVAQAFEEPLMPGQVSGEIFVKSFYGYSAKSKASFMKNINEWKKMNVKLFASTKGSGHARIGDIYPVKQEIEGMPDSSRLQAREKQEILDEKSFETLGKAIRIVRHDSIWMDRYKSVKKCTIVPSITIQVKNVGDEPIKDVFIKGEFIFQDNGEKLSEVVVKTLEKALPQGETSKDISINADLGYVATSKASFIKNNQTWRKVDVKIYVKQKDYNYVLLGTYPIRQEIEGVKVIYNFQQK